MNNLIGSPRKFGIPHDTWRSNQLALFLKVKENIDNKENSVIFGELAVGSGKSGVATAMGHLDNVLVVVHTLALLDQYRDKYGFSIIKGKQEYPCVLDEKIEDWTEFHGIAPTAADCHFAPMTKCSEAYRCPYIQNKIQATYAKRSACTYRYLGVSYKMKSRPGHLVFDEAHDAAEELIRFNEFQILNYTIQKFDLSKFPFSYYGDNNKGAILNEDNKDDIMDWLSVCLMRLHIEDEDAISGEGAQRRKLHNRFERFYKGINDLEWFLSIEKDKVIFKALTAKKIVEEIFEQKRTKLLMSGTIGDPQPLADIMGIEKWKSYSLPHPIPARYRPIEKLDVKSMTARNLKENPFLYRQQAIKIYNWIEKHPPSWRGVILTTSYKKIEKLADVLKDKYKGKRRLIVQEKGKKLGELIEQFISDVQRGDIAIGTIQGWGTGLDLYGELARWIVIAGVPHVNPTDEYMKARREIEGGIKYQKWLTYNAIMQAYGRITRGEKDEYGWISNYAAIADGSALTKTAEKYYAEWFRDAWIGE